MDDYISRQAAIEAVGYYCNHSGDKLLFADNALEVIPPADVRPVVRGRWDIVDRLGNEDIECSVCGEAPCWHTTEYQVRPQYCPNCGAAMRGDDAE